MLLAHETKHPNLYVPGLTPQGAPKTTIHVPGYFGRHSNEQLRGGRGDAFMADLLALSAKADPRGLAGIVQVDVRRGGKLVSRYLGHNVITDLGANAMLQAFGNTSPTKAPYIVADQSLAAAQFSANTGSGAAGTTTFAVIASSGGTAAGGNPAFQTANAGSTFQAAASRDGTKQNNNNTGITSATVGVDTLYGTGISLSFGTVNEEGVAGSTTANNSTTINVPSFTTLKAHAINEWAMAHGSTADNPTTTPTGAVFSPAQNPSPSGAGIATRQIVLSYTWAAGILTPSANPYTGVWLATAANSGAWGAGVAYARAPITPITATTLTTVTITYTIKI